jgi:hypothetical protein
LYSASVMRLCGGDQHFVALRILDFVGQLAVDQPLGNVPVQIAVAQGDSLNLVKGPQNFLVRFHAQRAQENRAEEFSGISPKKTSCSLMSRMDFAPVSGSLS